MSVGLTNPLLLGLEGLTKLNIVMGCGNRKVMIGEKWWDKGRSSTGNHNRLSSAGSGTGGPQGLLPFPGGNAQLTAYLA